MGILKQVPNLQEQKAHLGVVTLAAQDQGSSCTLLTYTALPSGHSPYSVLLKNTTEATSAQWPSFWQSSAVSLTHSAAASTFFLLSWEQCKELQLPWLWGRTGELPPDDQARARTSQSGSFMKLNKQTK